MQSLVFWDKNHRQDAHWVSAGVGIQAETAGYTAEDSNRNDWYGWVALVA